MLLELFELLLNRFGYQHWWPADNWFEVCIGAILTQNTAWNNVEKAIFNLKELDYLSPEKINSYDMEILKTALKPAGFYNQKADRLKLLSKFIIGVGGFNSLSALSVDALRDKLLSLRGIGKETADSMILYAFNKPIFVVDAYTKRLFFRLGFIDSEKVDYDFLRLKVEEVFPKETELLKEFHALIVRQCKEFCRKKPLCKGCPLYSDCKFDGKGRD